MRLVCLLICLGFIFALFQPAFSADQKELLKRFKEETLKKNSKEGFWGRYREKMEQAFLIGSIVAASILISVLKEDGCDVSFRWPGAYICERPPQERWRPRVFRILILYY